MIFGPLKFVLRVIVGLVGVIVLYFAVTFVQIWLTGRHHSSHSAQAILVFGTAENNGTPSPELADRLDHALVLYQEHRAPYIVVTGGKRAGDRFTEAGVSTGYLEAHGVPANRIIAGSGADTWQNVASIMPALRALHITTVITVTDPFHEDRAMAIASAQGLTTYPSPVTNSAVHGPGLWRYYLKETLEVGVGRVIGFQTLSNWFHAD